MEIFSDAVSDMRYNHSVHVHYVNNYIIHTCVWDYCKLTNIHFLKIVWIAKTANIKTRNPYELCINVFLTRIFKTYIYIYIYIFT